MAFDAQAYMEAFAKQLIKESKPKRKRGKNIGLKVYRVIGENGEMLNYHKKPIGVVVDHIGKYDCEFLYDEYLENGYLPTFEDMTKDQVLKYIKEHRGY